MHFVSLEGNIGSGKSSLIKYWKENPPQVKNANIVVVEEPVDCWESICSKDGKNILQHYYQDSKKYSFAFQVLALSTRLKNMRHLIKTELQKQSQTPTATDGASCPLIIVTERSLQADRHIFATMLFDDGLLEDICFNIYKTMYDEFASDFNQVAVIHLNTAPSVCLERIQKRGRMGEETISQEYLDKLEFYHQQFINEIASKSPHFVSIDTLHKNVAEIAEAIVPSLVNIANTLQV